jgi:transmembrane sensor
LSVVLLQKAGILNSLLTMQDEKLRELFNKYNEGNCSPEEIAWLESAYLKWNDADKLTHSEEELVKARKLMWQEVDARTKPVIIRKLWPRISAVASILLFISFGLFYNRYSNSHLTQPNLIVISSKAGEKRSVILADGTNIILNGESSITLAPDFNLKSRKLTLSGEAFFKVVHNAAKPFIVHTYSLDVEDIGTEFNVKAYPNDKNVEATLIKGKIELTMNNAAHTKIMILPQQKLVLNNIINSSSRVNIINKNYSIQSITKNPEYKSIVETDWTKNLLTLNDEKFDEIAISMERWYNVKITFQNPSMKDYRFVATFDNEDIIQVLELLKQTRAFNYRKEGDEIIIY